MNAREKIIMIVHGMATDAKRYKAPDAVMLNMILSVIEDVQDRVCFETKTLLYGIAAELMERMIASLPKPKRTDAKGIPVFSEEELAQAFGCSPGEMHTILEQLQGDGVIKPLRESETHTLN